MSVAAFERTENRVEASALLQMPLEKFTSEDWMMAFTIEREVESMVVRVSSVAGLMTAIRVSVGGW